jgi:hypothetical protein
VTAPGSLTIRSFRVVFSLERRIHKVDRWRLPVPYGIPLRGIAYWALALTAVVVAGSLPLTATIVGVLPPPVRYAIGPVAASYALTQMRVDGRPAHTALAAWTRFKIAPSRLSGLRRAPAVGTVVRIGDVVLAPDEHFARYRAAVVEGPATVVLRYPPFGWVRPRGRSDDLHVRQVPGPPLVAGRRVALKARQRLVVHG